MRGGGKQGDECGRCWTLLKEPSPRMIALISTIWDESMGKVPYLAYQRVLGVNTGAQK